MKPAQGRLLVPGILLACVVLGAALTLSQSQSPKVRFRHLVDLVSQSSSAEVFFGKGQSRIRYPLTVEDIAGLSAWLRSSVIDVDPLPWGIHGGIKLRCPQKLTVIIILSAENRVCIFEDADGWNSRIYVTGPTSVAGLVESFRAAATKPR